MPAEPASTGAPALPRPLISVIMANYNGVAFLRPAIESVLAQRGVLLELILIDDASSDSSALIMREIEQRDRRVRVFVSAINVGPAAARNVGLNNAAGSWIAVVDSDDLLHPDRMARLLDAARADEADIAADGLLQFDHVGGDRPLAVLGSTAPGFIALPSYIRSNALFGRATALGYLKPLFRVDTTFGRGFRYDPALRISEDYDLVLRMMLSGARLKTYPHLTYFYRKHAGSISHRLSETALRAMLRADEAITGAGAPDVASAMAYRRRSIARALAFTSIVRALKARDAMRAIGLAARHPAATALLALPVFSALGRIGSARGAPPQRGPTICVISRQRVVGNTNGSSAYLLDLCRTMVAQGWRVHFVCPSPALFGRWPVLFLQPEMRVFSSLRIRGGLRIGSMIVAVDPRIALRACATLGSRLMRRLGIRCHAPETRAPYAVAAPLLPKDQLFLARHAREHGDVIMADYAFLTDGFAYALRPDAETAVIMHDLFSSRTAQFAGAGATDSVAVISAEAEYAMLDQADTVIAIQPDEAARASRSLPGKRVLTAPMSMAICSAAQPGSGRSLLFVGGNTAPNILGLKWFLTQVWPIVLGTLPDATISVIGEVGTTIGAFPRVRLVGRVADLAPYYRQAAIVISPLLMGSGLKIKLVEAMAHGKAIVAAPASLQGMPCSIHDAVIEADTAAAFSSAILQLLGSDALRRMRGETARCLAQELFSREVAHAPLVEWLGRAIQKVGGAVPAPPNPPSIP